MVQALLLEGVHLQLARSWTRVSFDSRIITTNTYIHTYVTTHHELSVSDFTRAHLVPTDSTIWPRFRRVRMSGVEETYSLILFIDL